MLRFAYYILYFLYDMLFLICAKLLCLSRDVVWVPRINRSRIWQNHIPHVCVLVSGRSVKPQSTVSTLYSEDAFIKIPRMVFYPQQPLPLKKHEYGVTVGSRGARTNSGMQHTQESTPQLSVHAGETDLLSSWNKWGGFNLDKGSE